MKGIILAGGLGTRMYPITMSISKQLLCVYDKPMIYYSLSILLRAGLKEILIITTTNDLESYKNLLGDGINLGINIYYRTQAKPEGIAQAFIIAEDFIQKDDVCMILGDNIFYGNGLDSLLNKSILNLKNSQTATLYAYYVNDPNRYGVFEFNQNGKVISIEEKPIEPKSNYAVVGIYFYPNSVINFAKQIEPSKRGELEITAINNIFLNKNKLDVEILGPGYTWLDAGTPDSLLEASNFIQTIEKRQGLKVGCIEEIAYKKGFINYNQLINLSKRFAKSEYSQYLNNILKK